MHNSSRSLYLEHSEKALLRMLKKLYHCDFEASVMGVDKPENLVWVRFRDT